MPPWHVATASVPAARDTAARRPCLSLFAFKWLASQLAAAHSLIPSLTSLKSVSSPLTYVKAKKIATLTTILIDLKADSEDLVVEEKIDQGILGSHLERGFVMRSKLRN